MSIGMVGFSWVRLRLSVGVGSGGGRRPRETMQILRTYQFEGYHIFRTFYYTIYYMPIVPW
jgi:hypothetical protein